MYPKPIQILSAILALSALFGSVWGVLRLISVRKRKSKFAQSPIEEQQKALKSEILKIRQIMYSPLAFLKSYGIVFPLYTVFVVISRVIMISDSIAGAGRLDFMLISGELSNLLILSCSFSIIIMFVWALYFYFNHVHRKLILDMQCLAGSE